MKTHSRKRHTLVAMIVSIAMVFSVIPFVNMDYASAAAEGSRRSTLSATDKKVYDYLKKEITKIAAGERSDAKIVVPGSAFLDKEYAFTLKELGLSEEGNVQITGAAAKIIAKKLELNVYNIIEALQYDLPYELYWHNKITGVYKSDIPSFSIDENARLIFGSNSTLTFNYDVSEDYAAGTGKVDTAKTKKVKAVIAKAKEIIKNAPVTSDYDKLKYYKEKICDLVTYNNKAAEDSTVPYGDPWQMIYVFDGDPSTNVVCEGYAKAFKYLCDNTDFKGNVRCEIMTGQLIQHQNVDVRIEDHMWNLVTMDDGKNYIADITNCDNGSIGYPNKLLLVGSSNSTASGYKITIDKKYVQYSYDDYTTMLFTDKERTISKSNYITDSGSSSGSGSGSVSHTHDMQKTAAVSPKCTAAGNVEYYKCKDCGKYYKDVQGKYEITNLRDTVLKPTGHYWKADDVSFDHNGNATIYYTCKYCGEKKSESSKIEESDTNEDQNLVITTDDGKTIELDTDVVDIPTNEQGVLMTDCEDPVTPTEKAADNARKVSTVGKIAAAKIGTEGSVKKKTMTFGWKKVKGAVNYRVAYRKAGAKNWTYAWTGGSGKVKYVLKKLKANQMIEFKVAAYGAKDGKWVQGGWSKVCYRYLATTTAKVKAGKKSFKATIKKVKKSSGYEVIYALNKAQTKSKKVKSLKGAGKTKFVAKKLKKGKKYYVSVRPYKKYKGKKYIGLPSKTYKVKAK